MCPGVKWHTLLLVFWFSKPSLKLKVSLKIWGDLYLIMTINNREHIKQWTDCLWAEHIARFMEPSRKQAKGVCLGHSCGILNFGCWLQSFSSFLCDHCQKCRLGGEPEQIWTPESSLVALVENFAWAMKSHLYVNLHGLLTMVQCHRNSLRKLELGNTVFSTEISLQRDPGHILSMFFYESFF